MQGEGRAVSVALAANGTAVLGAPVSTAAVVAPKYKGVLSTISTIVKQEGPR